MSDLTPEEQRFFETGEIQPGMVPNAPAANTPPDPLALSGVGAGNPAPPSTPVAPVASPDPTQLAPQQPPQAEVTELLRRSLAEAQQRAANLEAQVTHLNQPKPPAEEPAPDPNVDPLGAMLHQINAVNKRVAELQAQLGQQAQQQTQAGQFQAFQQQVQGLRDQFIKSAPDFYDAYNHLRETRTADLRAFGMNDQQINQTLLQEEVALSENAIRQGRNPAEVVYDIAKRHGYAVKMQQQASVTPAAKIQQLQQSVSTQPPPRSVNPEDFTLDGLKDASDADLNRLVMNDAAWNKIAGKDSYPL